MFARLLSYAPFMLYVACWGNALSADDGLPLQARFTPFVPVSRSCAPFGGNYHLQWHGPALLEGHLEWAIQDGHQVLGTFRSEDIVLTNSEYRLPLVIPPVPSGVPYPQLELHAQFVAGDRRVVFQPVLLRMAQPWLRHFTIGAISPNDRSLNREFSAFFKMFSFERFTPVEGDATCQTATETFDPEDVLTDPLSLCVYDLLVLHGNGLRELRTKQRDAISQWVSAGGSLCVLYPERLEPEQVAFLNTLVSDEFPEMPFTLSLSGELVDVQKSSPDAPSIRLVHKGLGRVALIEQKGMPSLNSDSSEVRAMVAFLWKVRRDQWPFFLEHGRWDVETIANRWLNAHREATQEDAYTLNGTSGVASMSPWLSGDRLRMSPYPLNSGEALLRDLMPENVDLVPMWVIASLLGLYVLTIGPGDYFVLGYLKSRRWTWIVFPILTLGFALFAVWLSHYYMQSADNRGALVVADLDNSGNIVRENRFEILFNGASKDAVTETRHALFTPMDLQMFGYAGQANAFAGYAIKQQSRLVGAPVYSGRIPSRFEVSQALPQWTPQLNRMLSISPKAGPVTFDWNSVTREELWHLQKRETFLKRLQAAFDTPISVYVLQGRTIERIFGDEYLTGRQVNTVFHSQTQPESTFLQDTCVRRHGGLFELVTQVSPTCGDNFEDLSLLDSSDPNHWMLVVITKADGKICIYRKTYHTQPGADFGAPEQSVEDDIGSALRAQNIDSGER